jgi:hypothetical protein
MSGRRRRSVHIVVIIIFDAGGSLLDEGLEQCFEIRTFTRGQNNIGAVGVLSHTPSQAPKERSMGCDTGSSDNEASGYRKLWFIWRCTGCGDEANDSFLCRAVCFFERVLTSSVGYFFYWRVCKLLVCALLAGTTRHDTFAGVRGVALVDCICSCAVALALALPQPAVRGCSIFDVPF